MLEATHHKMGLIPCWVLGNFQVTFSFCLHSVALGSNQPVMEMSTKEFPWGLNTAGAYSRQLCHPSQMKHQLDATLCRFYFCRVTLHISGASAHHQEYLKLVQRPLVHVLSLQVSHHISLLGPSGPNKRM